MPNNRKIVYWLDQTKFYRISIHYRQINTLFGYEIGFYKANGNLKKEHQKKKSWKNREKIKCVVSQSINCVECFVFFYALIVSPFLTIAIAFHIWNQCFYLYENIVHHTLTWIATQHHLWTHFSSYFSPSLPALPPLSLLKRSFCLTRCDLFTCKLLQWLKWLKHVETNNQLTTWLTKFVGLIRNLCVCAAVAMPGSCG